jgi:hypothetical protein
MKLLNLISIILLLSSFTSYAKRISVGVRSGLYGPDKPIDAVVLDCQNYEVYLRFHKATQDIQGWIEASLGINSVPKYTNELEIYLQGQTYRYKIEETYKTKVSTVFTNIEGPLKWKNTYYFGGIGLIVSIAELERKFFKDNVEKATVDGFGCNWPYKSKKTRFGLGFSGGIGYRFFDKLECELFFRYACCPIKDANWRFYESLWYDIATGNIMVSSTGEIKNTEGIILTLSIGYRF